MFSIYENIFAWEASLLAAIISGVGLVSMALFGDLGRRYSPYISAFAVGLLVNTTIFHLIPEGYELTVRIWQWIALGFGVFLLTGFLLRILTSGQSLNTDLAFASSSIFALGTHSFLDGVLYALAFQGEAFTGWVTVLGLLIHELPEGIIIYYLLRESRLNRAWAIIISFIAACLTTLAGTGAALSFLDLASASISVIMGITAGAFIYILIFHLAPHAAKAPDRRGYLAAGLGVLVSMAALLLQHM